MSKLEAELEDAVRKGAAAQLEAARALDGARSQAAAAEREAEVLRAGAGAATDQALAALKVRRTPNQCISIQLLSIVLVGASWKFLHRPC